MAEKLKITYATLSDSNEEIHRGYEAGLVEARTLLGASYGNFVNGEWITDGATFEKRTPIDGSLVGTFTKGDRSTAKSAIAAAKAAFPAWSAKSWEERVKLIRAAHVTREIDTPGYPIIECNDRPIDSRHLDLQLAMYENCDMAVGAAQIHLNGVIDSIAMAEMALGGPDALEANPGVFGTINANSPLMFDTRMLESLWLLAERNQIVNVTPFIMMGAMGPVSVPAALAQQTLEAGLAGHDGGAGRASLHDPLHPIGEREHAIAVGSDDDGPDQTSQGVYQAPRAVARQRSATPVEISILRLAETPGPVDGP